MNWKDLINEGSIALTLVVTIAGLVIITVVSGADSVAATGLRDLAILLGGALAGTKIPENEMSAEAVVHPTKVADEQREVDMRRYQEAYDAGLSHEQAMEFSFGGQDVGLLRILVNAGLEPVLIGRIIL